MNIPKQIFLQWHGDGPAEDSDVDDAHVTWCRDRVFDNDVEYIRAPQWRPISEAPKDGTVFLGLVQSLDKPIRAYRLIYWHEEYRRFVNINGGNNTFDLFQPLPEPPKQ